jgi:hypothetical protein
VTNTKIGNWNSFETRESAGLSQSLFHLYHRFAIDLGGESALEKPLEALSHHHKRQAKATPTRFGD